MSRLYWRRQALLAKIESVYGTDPTPTGGDNAVMAMEVSVSPLEGQSLERAYLQPFFGSRPSLPTERHARVVFEVELQGSGTAGTAPAYDPLLRAAALKATVTEGTDVTYEPVSDPATQESVTLHWNVNGNRHVVRGWRGNCTLVVMKQRYPLLRFNGLGLYSTPAAASLPEPDLSDWIAPLVAAPPNTSFSLFGSSRPLESLEINIGNAVEGRFLVNREEVVVSDRRGTGSVVIEAQPYGTFNPFSSVEGGSTGALSLVHGTVAGKIVQFAAPTVQLRPPTFGESQGIAIWTMPVILLPDEGDDEFALVVK